jgi:hypothetical protein
MTELATESQLWDILRRALATRVLALVADLRVADALAAGPRPVAEVAREVEAHRAKWLDLLMLAIFAGRERDESQWRALLAAAGFEPVSVEDGPVEARCR